jgi:putative membrane protein
MKGSRENYWLFGSYLVIAVLLGNSPNHRTDWALENSVPLAEALAVVWYFKWRGVELTPFAYRLVFVHLIVQVIGGHYTYAEVPLFNWLRDEFGWARNHYDRLAHFALGFCLYIPVREICLRRTPLCGSRAWSGFFTFTTITAIAGLWEVWEWLVAAAAYSDLGAAYLGTQGDPWDAQKDIVLAPIGVIVSALLLSRLHDRAIRRFLGADAPSCLKSAP